MASNKRKTPSFTKTKLKKILNDKYKIDCRINSGTFGSVFSAYSKTDKCCKLAIKVYHDKDGDYQKIGLNTYTAREIRIIEILQSKSFQYIVPIYDVGVDPYPYMVMPFIPTTWDTLCLSTFPVLLSLKVFQTLTYQLLLAVNHMHQNGILHRDIKGENVLLKNLLNENSTVEDVHVYVSDFGMSRELSYGPKRRYSRCSGTAPCRSIEVALGDSLYGTPFDIWSSALMIYELLSKESLFTGSTLEEVKQSMETVFGGKPIQTWLPKNYYVDCNGMILMVLEDTTLNIDLDTTRLGKGMNPWDESISQSKAKLRTNMMKFCSWRNNHEAVDSILDLLTRMLDTDPSRRISVQDALSHPFFSIEN